MKRVFFILIVVVAIAIAPALLVARSSAPASAAQNYSKQCATCHGKDGRAKTLKGRVKHARNLTDAGWQEQVTDERIFNSIMNGKGKMPSYSKKLSEAEIDALVSYVRALKK
ncbi:MAG TPA: cytochrome c [Pyrinomonadaceae bacterium]|nr:cytochrome c [Pyrinomonadaceae bacterium]